MAAMCGASGELACDSHNVPDGPGGPSLIAGDDSYVASGRNK